MESLFAPKTIAIIGASPRAGSLAARLERNLRLAGDERTIYLVNPRYTEIGDEPCYPDVSAIPGRIDLACILLSTERVADAVRDCGEAGVAAAVVFSSGFGEIGESGREQERALGELARSHNMRILGPNCQGLAVFSGDPLYATFSNAFASGTVRPGPVAYIGQSGAIGGAVLDKARERGIGMSLWVSTGNQLDLDVLSVADAVLERDDTRVVLVYMEGLTSGAKLRELAVKADALGKRLVLLQVGTSERGAQAVASHTGAILPPSRALRTLSEEIGIDVVHDVDDLLDMATAASAARAVTGRRVAVITSSGGGGIIAADQSEPQGFTLAEFAQDTRDHVGELLPNFGSVENPVDVTTALFSGPLETLGDDFAEVCRRVSVSDEVDAIVIVLTMIVGERAERLAQALTRLAHESTKPVRVAWLTGYASNTVARETLIAAGIPVFASVSAAVRAMARERQRFERRESLSSGELIGAYVAEEQTVDLRDVTAPSRLLDAWAVPQPDWEFVSSLDEAAQFASQANGARYAVKGVGPRLQHKTEAKAVYLGVAPTDIVDRCREIADGPAGELGLDGYLLQEMAETGLEMFVSITRQDEGFPPLLAVGLGGVSIEIDPDIVTATLPTTSGHVRAMLAGLRGAPLLGEFRGRSARDLDALLELISALAAGFLAQPTLNEVELNPVMLYEAGRGARAVDALFL